MAVWAALADDDDARLLELYYPPSLELQFPGGPRLKLAAGLRGSFNVTEDECRAMGVTMSARILPDGSGGDAVAFISVRTLGFAIHYEQPTNDHAYMPVAYRRRPSAPWLFWGGVTQEELDTAEYVDLGREAQP